jgi:hypothetical protein
VGGDCVGASLVLRRSLDSGQNTEICVMG